ncbi:MAG: hypothetical protein N2645_18400 [Clostridia bacterium]|nr:hypothetical protein [Clostridia bacterium]
MFLKMKSFLEKAKSNKVVTAGAVTAGTVSSFAVSAFAVDEPSTGTAADVSSVVALLKGLLGLFSYYPLNIILLMGLAYKGFTLFHKAKKSAA